MKYRRKSVIIEAVPAYTFIDAPFLPREELNLPEWVKVALENGVVEVVDDYFPIKIRTLEGDHYALQDDMIIKGVAGEIYPCKPEIFNLIYEPVEEENNYGNTR